MKKFYIVFCLLTFSLVSYAMRDGSPIDLSTEVIDPEHGQGIRPMAPMQPPTIYLEDYTLLFGSNHPEYVLNIKDEDDDVVFSTTVYSTLTQVVLPSTLSGDYEIELLMGNWRFTGWINL